MRSPIQSPCSRDARTTRDRAGVALIVVLVSLAIVSSIAMTLVRLSLLHHKQAAHETTAAQSRWLAEWGFDRAVRQLKSDEPLTHATWTVPAKELDGRHSASVTVEVQEVENAPKQRRVIVTADYPIEVTKRSRIKLDRSVTPL